MSFIPETIIRALCWTLLHSLWQGLILAVAAGAVMLMTRRAKSARRYTILSVLVIAFLAVSGYTYFRELRLPVTEPSTAHLLQPQTDALTGPVVIAQGVAPVMHPHSPVMQLVQYFNTHASLVVVVWFIVFLARLVKLFSGLVYAQRIRHYRVNTVPAEWQERLEALLQRLRISRPVRLLESALIRTPVVVGWLKPLILVPVGMLAQLSAEQVETILLHELAHISRRDYIFNVIQHLVDTLFFFNPALLWVSSLIRTERENCCDDVAIRETRSRRQLIEALVSFHEYQQSARGYAMGFAGEKNGMVRRVERIVHKRNHSLNAGERLLLVCGVMLLCGVLITINTGTQAEGLAPAAKTITAAGATTPTTPTTAATPTKADPVHTAITATAPAGTTRPHQNTAATPAHLATPADTTKKDTSAPAAMTRADIDLLIRAREHGVTPEFVTEMKQLGYTVSLEQAIRLVDHGVNADFIRSIQKEGYGKLSLENAVRLIDHGVTPDFIRSIRAQGFTDLTLDQAVELVDHGVTADFIRKWKEKSGGKLEFSDYLKLRDSGIDPS